jgi:hypothetical protein
MSYRNLYFLAQPSGHNRKSVENWIHNNKPLIEKEARFIRYREDLVSLTVPADEGILDRFMQWTIYKLVPPKIGSWVR